MHLLYVTYFLIKVFFIVFPFSPSLQGHKQEPSKFEMVWIDKVDLFVTFF